MFSSSRSVVGNGFGMIGFHIISTICGIVIFAVYAIKNCDPLTAGVIESQVQVKKRDVFIVQCCNALLPLPFATLVCKTFHYKIYI